MKEKNVKSSEGDSDCDSRWKNESMGGIDLVNLRQWCETNCITCSSKLGQTVGGMGVCKR